MKQSEFNRLRQLNKEWQEGNNYLFDIGKNMDKLVNREHIFYTDQKTARMYFK